MKSARNRILLKTIKFSHLTNYIYLQIHYSVLNCYFAAKYINKMATPGKGTFQPDSDVHISYEDQQKINKFARLNAKVDDYKDELKVKQNDVKNLEDAVDELSLADDSVKIPYLVGEVFICQNLEDTLKSLEEAKNKKENEMSDLEGKIEELKAQMSELKAHLYGKFGSHINLENEEE